MSKSNSPADRTLTARLYSSDLDLRISQEIMLGIGGVRALRMLGYNPSVWHMNEGHSAFLVLERIRELVEAGHDASMKRPRDGARPATVFTTHTPVPAGNDEFPLWLMDKYFSQSVAAAGLDPRAVHRSGPPPRSAGAIRSACRSLALRLSAGRNAVSELHGQVARKMWHYLWPDRPEEEVPITHITNGVHTGTWLARRLRLLYDRYLGAGLAGACRRPGYLGAGDEYPRRRAVGGAHAPEAQAGGLHARTRPPAAGCSGGWHPVQVVASGVLLDPYVADDRLCPPLCPL